MKAKQPSRTADAVAAVRAAHLLHDRPIVFEDPFAIDLTSLPWRMVAKSRLLYWLVAKKILGGQRPVHAQILARSRYAEDQLQKAIAVGVTQYVLLGAGLDSFALRRRDLATIMRVYELDHPVSQMTKRKRLARLRVDVPENLEFVPVDFEKETLIDALARSSYMRERPAFFSWLGTTVYLTREAVMNTLGSLVTFAAPGSEIVLSYVIPLELVEPADRAVLDRVARFAARRGEPWITFFDPFTFPQEVSALGFEFVENLSPREQEARYFAGRADDLHTLSDAYFGYFRVIR
jgi:methyltransferase (TIGR00027 family)